MGPPYSQPQVEPDDHMHRYHGPLPEGPRVQPKLLDPAPRRLDGGVLGTCNTALPTLTAHQLAAAAMWEARHAVYSASPLLGNCGPVLAPPLAPFVLLVHVVAFISG